MTEPWQSEEFDAIVVGSGPGGATVAKELSRCKKKVLILEWGSNAPAKGTLLQTIGIGLIPGKSLNDVVDSNLQTEYEGLYVCDCSVMPEAWGLPPTLTIVALGKRLSKHPVGKEEPVEVNS